MRHLLQARAVVLRENGVETQGWEMVFFNEDLGKIEHVFAEEDTPEININKSLTESGILNGSS